MTIEFPRDLFRRWLLFGIAAVAGGELVFALISGYLDQQGDVANMAGHIVTLVPFGALIYVAQRRALRMPISWLVAGAIGLSTFVSYGAGFVLMGPPADFLLSLLVTGVATGLALWLSLRGRLRGAALCIAAVGLGYAVGAAVGVGFTIPLGRPVNDFFGSGVTGFMGVVGMIGIIAGTVGSLVSGFALARILSPRTELETSAVAR